MPLTNFQIEVLTLLASHRSPDSYVAGGIALNRSGPRFSEDIDIFQDELLRLESAAKLDEEVLLGEGYEVTWTQILTGKRQADISRTGEGMRLEWVHDSAFRFFPAQKDQLFGYVLHPADLATNKASAAADRREPRDIVDLLTINDQILGLGATICAAVGRFPGQSPEGMLADIRRHARFTSDEFESLQLDKTATPEDIGVRTRQMLEEAEWFINRVPSHLIGHLFMKDGIPMQPEIGQLEDYQLRSGSVGGIWPSTAYINHEMLQTYRNDPAKNMQD